MGRTVASQFTTPKPQSTAAGSLGRTSEKRANDGFRETMEALIVAGLAALLVRGFLVQAFVIPTGSMAPTLMGRHKEVTCPQCGFVFAVNASEEVEAPKPRPTVHSGVCVNCRHLVRKLETEPSYKGDRILVSMFPYDLPFLPGARPPDRWDVVVFHYPEAPEINYIKRLVGLPGETVRIHHGDIYIQRPGESDFRLERKPIKQMRAMQINVYDDRHQARAFRDRDEWRRWRPEAMSGWSLVVPGESLYRCDQPTEDWTEFRYRHLVPEPDQWESLLNDRTPARPPQATLITDFYSYNTTLPNPRIDSLWYQPHWVGDLTLEADLEVQSESGEIRLELIKAGVRHDCTIDVATGKATLSRNGRPLIELDSPIVGAGKRRVEFANVDDRLSLVVDGRVVGGPGVEFDLGDEVPIPTAEDLSPAAIAAKGAVVSASGLVLKRDIYYTQDPGDVDYGLVWGGRPPGRAADLFDFLADPSRFHNLVRVRSQDYDLGDDRFLMMGDNSPRSKDSRGWDSHDRGWDVVDRQPWEVPRSLVTGKAFFVYWPHGVPFGPSFRLSRDFSIPFRPYFEQMRWIR